MRDKSSMARDCTMEEAIEKARNLILTERTTEVVLFVICNNKVVELGTYCTAEDPKIYDRKQPGVRCVEVQPKPHGLPKSDYWNAEAWSLYPPGYVQDVMDKIRRGRPRKNEY